MRHSQLTDDLQEQASLYAAGALPEDERKEYARHLEEDQCAVCQAEVTELQSATGLLAFGLPEQAPSPAVRERLLEQARNTAPVRPASSVGRRPWLLIWVQAAALAVLVLVAIVLNQDNSRLHMLTDSLLSRIAQLENQLSQERTFLVSLTSPENRVIDLAGVGGTSAGGRLFWDTQQQKWRLYIQDLPQVPDDRVYQLWFIPRSGNPVSVAAFNTDAAGSATREIDLPPTLTDLKQAAVTNELAPEKPQPMGTVVLASTAE